MLWHTIKCNLLVIYCGASLCIRNDIQSTILLSIFTIFLIICSICLEQLRVKQWHLTIFCQKTIPKICSRQDSYLLLFLFVYWRSYYLNSAWLYFNISPAPCVIHSNIFTLVLRHNCWISKPHSSKRNNGVAITDEKSFSLSMPNSKTSWDKQNQGINRLFHHRIKEVSDIYVNLHMKVQAKL